MSLATWLIRVCGVIVFTTLLVASTSFVFGDDTKRQSVSESDSIESLINKLDSRSYSQREAAMKSLGMAGKNALEPLAFRLLEGSPECSWRIKVILEEIGTRGDSETFLKAVGILKIFVGSTPELLSLEQK